MVSKYIKMNIKLKLTIPLIVFSKDYKKKKKKKKLPV